MQTWKKNILTIILSLGLIIISLVTNTFDVLAYKNATNVYVGPTKTKPSDILILDWQAVDTTPGTYWAVHNWNQGGEAGGYAGFQQHKDKRTIHFALWDPISVKEEITAEYLDENTETSRFGGEGTGRKVYANYDWQVEQWYSMALRSWQEDGHTKYGQWVKDEKGNWLQSAILDFPVSNVSFKYGHGLFQEDFTGTNDLRSFKIKNSYARTLDDNEWVSYDEQKISSSGDLNWNGGTTNEYFWGAGGGDTIPEIKSGQIFKVDQPDTPDMGKIELDTYQLNTENDTISAQWNLKGTSSPQFKAQIVIKNNGKVVKEFDEVKSYETQFDSEFKLSDGDTVSLLITDIFDNQQEFPISNDTEQGNNNPQNDDVTHDTEQGNNNPQNDDVTHDTEQGNNNPQNDDVAHDTEQGDNNLQKSSGTDRDQYDVDVKGYTGNKENTPTETSTLIDRVEHQEVNNLVNKDFLPQTGEQNKIVYIFIGITLIFGICGVTYWSYNKQ